MKLTVVSLLLAFFAGVGSVVAQDERRDYSEERMKLRAEWMALDMAERYGLDEKQVKELTEANLEWLQKQGDVPVWRRDARAPRWDGRRHHRRDVRRGGCCGAPRPADYCCGDYCAVGRHVADCPYYGEERRPQLSKEEREKRQAERQKKMEEWRDARDAYEKSLQKIMTEEQYKAYSERRR